MDEISINTVNDYLTLRQALGNELSKAAISFCRIGYLLKRARDEENILQDSGYDNVNAFALAEFGLDKSQVSRFIRINDKFSVGGYSEHLKSEYEQYGYTKLSLMLLLPDEINEELSPEYSKSDISAIVKDYKEEEAITDMEVMMEDKSDAPDEFIAAVVKELNDEHPEPLEWFEESIEIADNLGTVAGIPDIKEAYMPDGESIYNIRIAGQGKYMVKMCDDGITITNMRQLDEKSPLTWQEFLEAVREDRINRPAKPKQEEKKAEKPRKAKRVEPTKLKKAKGLTEEEKKEAEEFFTPIVKGIEAKYADVAPEQPESEPETGKIVNNEPEIVENESEIVKNEPEIVQEEESLPFPEVMPEEKQPEPQSDEEHPAAGVEKVEGEEFTPEDQVIEELYDSIRNLEDQIIARNWTRALIYVEDIEFRIKRMKGV